MKKIVVVVVLLALAVLPYVFGSKTESSIQAFIDRMEAENTIEVESFEYERGWFSSTYSGVIWSKPKTYRLETSGKVYHGPIAFGALSAGANPIGLGVIESNDKVSLSLLLNDEDLIEFMSEPLHSVSNLSFGQTISGELNYAANEIVKGDTIFSLMPAEVNYNYNLKSDDLSIDGSLEGFDITTPTVVSTFGSINADISTHREEGYAFMVGGGEITMDTLNISISEKEKDTTITFNDMFLKSDSDLLDRKISMDGQYGIDTITIADSDKNVAIKGLLFDVVMDGLDAKAMEDYTNIIKSIENFEDPQFVTEIFSALADVFSQGEPHMAVTMSGKSISDDTSFNISDVSVNMDTAYKDGWISFSEGLSVGGVKIDTEATKINAEDYSSLFEFKITPHYPEIAKSITMENIDTPESKEKLGRAMLEFFREGNLEVDIEMSNKLFTDNNLFTLSDASVALHGGYQDDWFNAESAFALGNFAFEKDNDKVAIVDHSSKLTFKWAAEELIAAINEGFETDSTEVINAAFRNLNIDILFNHQSMIANVPGVNIDAGVLEMAGKVDVIDGIAKSKVKLAIERVDYQEEDGTAYNIGKSFFEQENENIDLPSLITIGTLSKLTADPEIKATSDQLMMDMFKQIQPSGSLNADINLNDDFIRISGAATFDADVVQQLQVPQQLMFAADAQAEAHVTEGMLHTISTLITSMQVKPQAKQLGLSKEETDDMIAQQSAGQVRMVKSIGIFEAEEDTSLKTAVSFKGGQLLVNGAPFGQ